MVISQRPLVYQTTNMDWERLLEDIGISAPINKAEFIVPCPLHDDRVASCAINTAKGAWICFAGCGQGSISSLVMRVKGISLEEFNKAYQTDETSYDLDFLDSLTAETSGLTDTNMPRIDLPETFVKDYFSEWVYKRGFHYDLLSKWGCGSNNFGDLIIPLEDAYSRLVGWVSRRQNAVPKYWYSPGMRKSLLLFGETKLQIPEPFVCITEGTLDALWLIQHGIAAVALLGAVPSKYQIQRLQKIRTQELVMCLDNDSAGSKGMDRLRNQLHNSFILSRISLPSIYKDVQDVRNRTDLTNIVSNRYYW